MIGGGSTVTSFTLSIIYPSVGIVISSSTALLTSNAILITNRNIWKIKIGYTNLRDWIIAITQLYEKTLKTSVVVKKNDEIEALEFKRIFNHYLDKRKENMKNTQFKVEDILGDIIGEGPIPPEQNTKLTNS